MSKVCTFFFKKKMKKHNKRFEKKKSTGGEEAFRKDTIKFLNFVCCVCCLLSSSLILGVSYVLDALLSSLFSLLSSLFSLLSSLSLSLSLSYLETCAECCRYQMMRCTISNSIVSSTRNEFPGSPRALQRWVYPSFHHHRCWSRFVFW